jgi:cell wall-associated NlpC family hydrolase
MLRRFLVLLVFVAAASSTACATTGATPRPFPTPSPSPPSAAPVPSPVPESPMEPGTVRGEGGVRSGDAYAISGMALSLRGAPYQNGGSDPSGFDCSGLVWYVFAQHGIGLPRTVTGQFQLGSRVDKREVRPGDLVFFDTGGRGLSGARATHVGISIGGDEFVHAPSTTGEVRVERLGSSYWSSRFLEARRVQ